MLESAERDTTKDWKSVCIMFFAMQREKAIMSIRSEWEFFEENMKL